MDSSKNEIKIRAVHRNVDDFTEAGWERVSFFSSYEHCREKR